MKCVVKLLICLILMQCGSCIRPIAFNPEPCPPPGVSQAEYETWPRKLTGYENEYHQFVFQWIRIQPECTLQDK